MRDFGKNKRLTLLLLLILALTLTIAQPVLAQDDEIIVDEEEMAEMEEDMDFAEAQEDFEEALEDVDIDDFDEVEAEPLDPEEEFDAQEADEMAEIDPEAIEHDPLVEIGNITRLDDARDNQLVGYGIVVGLAGSGDSRRSENTVQSIANMLDNFGVEVETGDLSSRNVAAVMVTANLPHNARPGDTLDAMVSSMGDARSLQGGTLIMTPLQGPDNQIYGVAQGPLSIGGYNVRGGGQEVRENHPNSGYVPNGAIVEQNVDYELDRDQLTLVLENSNFETASEITGAINTHFVEEDIGEIAQTIDESQVQVDVPDDYANNVADFLAEINQLEVRPSMEAKVVINERTGTIVKGHNVRVSTVSVAHGNLTIQIVSRDVVHQPRPFTDGETVVITETDIEVDEEEGQLHVVEARANIHDLVATLNAIGASPRDLVSILQEIKAAGALHGTLEVR